MKPIRALMLVTLVLGGCATSHPIKGPNAKTAYVVKCASSTIDACYEKAAEVCPAGYTMLDRNSNPSGMLVPAGKSMLYSSGPSTLLVECKSEGS